ncbi:MAG TPA: RagB/SusD family nutrient uptake outer membrane protein [Prolixibacteraceae bacterium]|nr:RagB/SusD family nutrient uptake outer membrane protein [Prolixibacteraceae bacterium]
MKKTIFKIIVSVLLLTGCSDDFLNMSSPNALSDDVFWKSENDAMLAIAGCYDALQDGNIYGGGPWSFGINAMEGISDDAYWNWDHSYESITWGTHTSMHAGIKTWWDSCYKVIVRCNKVIALVPNIPMDEAKMRRIVAEAKFIRSLIYLHLTMTFRDVPLILEPQTLANADVPKNIKNEIINKIIDDLKEVTSVLPKEVPTSERGRVTSGAALGLLTRVYLYNNMWDEAATTAKKIINEYNYVIHPSYKDLFSLAGENSKEIIFAIEFERGIGEGQLVGRHFANAPPHMATLPNLVDEYYCIDGLPIDKSPLFKGDPSQLPSLLNLNYLRDVKRYINRDPRLGYTLVTNNSIWSGKPINMVYVTTGVVFRKWSEEAVGGISLNYTDNALNIQVIRYADILLMWAEASVMSGKYQESDIIDAINKIRQRGDVMMPKVEVIEGTGLSKEKLLTIIKHERRIELAYEGLRYFDLIRWGELKDAWNNGWTPKSNSRMYIEPRSNVWPIPQYEIDNNSALIQNPEWQ